MMREERLEMAGGGTLVLRQDGPRVRLEAERPVDGRGLYKVWLIGRTGGRMLLGTLAPEGGVLRLKRTLSVGELERLGCWPVTGAEGVLAFSFPSGERWYCEYHPERLLQDPELRRQIKGPMMCCRGAESFRLAVPFRSSSPLALESLFCLAQVEQVEGKPHLVWSFDREGTPKVPHKKDRAGNTNLQ